MTVIENDAKSDYLLFCPVCSKQLHPQNRTLTCPNNHRFDIAKEGYVNLLRLKKQPKFLGDSKEMFQARRTFLDEDYYAPLAKMIAQNIKKHLWQSTNQAEQPYRILDAGCGEGYYLRHLANQIVDTQSVVPSQPILFFGMDIAKDGPRMAAKRLPLASFFVADINERLLFPNGTIDTILNIFAPRNATEFARLLTRSGQLIVVIPNVNHLAELRPRFNLLEIQANKEGQIVEQMAAAKLRLTQSEPLSFPVQLSSAHIRYLLHMTPNYRHLTGEEQVDAVERTINDLDEPFHVTASFRLLTFMLTLDRITGKVK